MPHVIYDNLTLKQFLRLPEAKPALEYIDGKVVQKVSPKGTHSALQGGLIVRVRGFASIGKLGQAYPELRCTFGGISLVPDLAYFVRARIPKDAKGRLVDDVTIPPDLAIEILSPGQTIKALSARMTWCVRNGVRLAWLIQPTKGLVHVFEPDRAAVVLASGDTLTGGDVLPGFALPIDEMFGWLYED